ncbi:abortive phage resistance protein [Enterocloster clostridioformis]|nr:abortive phage resistance protein [Lachnoclostridium sp. YL32]NDO27579.1 Abi family protein [Enterocloster clostridioformis]OXE71378.1 abortive phage resistance protein [Enterocloster clostridioformis]
MIVLWKLAKPTGGGEPAGISLFYIIGDFNMMASKHFLTFSQQVESLKNEKHIEISDSQYAEKVLQRIGYFSLMGGYKQLFRIPFTKKYRPGTTFDEIVTLYQFDADLRELFLKYLLQIERHIGNLMAYYFIEAHGISQEEYMNPNNYDNISRNRSAINGLIKKLYGAVTSTEHEYVNYHRTQYGNIPLWITTSVLTFGSLSKMYNVLPQSLRSKVCRHFPAVNQRQLERYLSVLTKYRNVCAHSERLFTYKTVDQILDTPLHAKLDIQKKGNQYIYGKQDLFAVVIAFRYLLPKEDFTNFKRSLVLKTGKLNKKLVHITESELLEQMGFPDSWKNITRYPLTP